MSRGQRDARCCGAGGFQPLERIGDHRLDGRSGVRESVDEGAVGAVLQQAADQVGEQVPMGAHRIVGAAGNVALALREHPVVECLAHAVQALQLERRAARHLQDRRHRMGVVGGELGVEARPQPQQGLGAGEVGQVGVGLAGVDRIAGQAQLLGPFDLAVPIGALDQPHHEPAPMALGQLAEQADDAEGAALIGLDGDPEPLPAGQRGLGAERGEEVQAEIQARGLLGVDGQADVAGLRGLGQLERAGAGLGAHPLALGRLEPRVQGGELDGDAGAGDRSLARGGPGDRGDGDVIALPVGAGVGGGAGRLAEHVEGVAVARLVPLGRRAPGPPRWCDP